MKPMKKRIKVTTWSAIALLASAGSLGAHHSLASFDTSAPVWVTGTVARFENINPHSRIHVEQESEDGRTHRWLVDGATPRLLDRMGLDADTLKPGTVIEVCGFEGLQSQQAFRQAGLDSSSAEIPERFMNGTLLVMPDGRKQVLSDYGQLHQCLGPDDEDLLVR